MVLVVHDSCNTTQANHIVNLRFVNPTPALSWHSPIAEQCIPPQTCNVSLGYRVALAYKCIEKLYLAAKLYCSRLFNKVHADHSKVQANVRFGNVMKGCDNHAATKLISFLFSSRFVLRRAEAE